MCALGEPYRLNISVTISTSVSAAEIFSAEDILGGPPKRKDIMAVYRVLSFQKNRIMLDCWMGNALICRWNPAEVGAWTYAHRPGNSFSSRRLDFFSCFSHNILFCFFLCPGCDCVGVVSSQMYSIRPRGAVLDRFGFR